MATRKDNKKTKISQMGYDLNSNKSSIRGAQDSPNEIFARMATNDKEQNNRLSRNLSEGTYSMKKSASKKITRIRYLVCLLGLTALSMSQMSRMIMNQTIPMMVDKRMLKQNDKTVSSDGSCPWPEEQQTNQQQSVTIDPIYFYLTEIIPTETTATANPIEASEITTIPSNHSDGNYTENDKFMWTVQEQNLLKGAFFYSYPVFMIFGGRMAEIYGAKYVLLLSVGGSALINLATPWMARNNFNLLILSRIVMGSIQAGVFPGIYALIAKWLTMSEASIFAPLIKTNLRLGMLFGSAIPGILSGWPDVFLYTGYLSLAWSIIWILIATSEPKTNTWVSEAELEHIMKKKRKPEESEKGISTEMTERGEGKSETKPPKKVSAKKTPWLKIITSPSVIGLIIIKLSFNFGADFFAIQLASYLNYVLHATPEMVSFITSVFFSLQVALIVFVGWLAKYTVKMRPFGMSKTAIRILFQCTANFGIGFGLILMTFNNCILIFVGILLQVISLLSMFTAGGETMLPYDLSDEYPATIMAIANSIGNLSGAISTFLAAKILGNQGGSYDRWNQLINITAGLIIFGGVAFCFLVKAEPLNLDQGEKKQKKKEEDVESGEVAVADAPNGCQVEESKTAIGLAPCDEAKTEAPEEEPVVCGNEVRDKEADDQEKTSERL